MEKSSRFFTALPVIAVLTAMYYFNTEYLDLGMHLMYKGIIGLFLIFCAFISFLIIPKLVRLGILFKGSMILILPNLLIVFWSLFSWGVSFTSLADISRGISSQVYQIIAVSAMAGVLYLFGEEGIWYNLAAMLAANLIVIGQVIKVSGLVPYLQELKMSVVTFAAETGELMRGTEIHELTFAIGLYLLFFLIYPSKIQKHWLLAFLTLFCYLSGFKRIGAVAVIGSAVVWWVLGIWKKKDSQINRSLIAGSLFLTAAMFGYLILIDKGLFSYLEIRFGLDTMGRSDLYNYIRQSYQLNPLFMGNGAGYVSRLFSDNKSAYFRSMGALHNDILQIYVDIGFIGFLLWSLLMTAARTILLTKKGEGKLLCFCCILYCLITYTTDNTYYYPYVNSAVAMLILGHVLGQEEKGVLG